MIKRQLWAWFVAIILKQDTKPKTIIAHVSKNVLARKYKLEYGFDSTLIEKSFVESNNQITEQVLAVSSDKLKVKLISVIEPKNIKACYLLFH